MNTGPIWTLRELVDHLRRGPQANAGGVYVPARPIYFQDGGQRRLRAAWEVLRGRADAFTWPDNPPTTAPTRGSRA